MTSVRIDQNLASELLARAKRKGATAADVVAVEGGSASVQVRLSAVDKLSKAQEKRLGLRVYFGQRSAGASTSDLSPSSLDELVETTRSEEHTSELQSQSNLVCRLLLEKKKKPIGRLAT